MTSKPERLMRALSHEWQSTPAIARRLGLTWPPGGAGELAELRRVLYALWLGGYVEHEPHHGGHRWRLPSEGTGS